MQVFVGSAVRAKRPSERPREQRVGFERSPRRAGVRSPRVSGLESGICDTVAPYEWSQPSGEWEIYFLTGVSPESLGADDSESIAQ